ncbi:uncharacterized protein LOC128997126 [Macrosteles quadrilineatus]|uniref:uncharacterized protein LOC128997126 n=1 Tax=Macrosteles quadrilineatus TaxID=74068 RepID=UPI0023E22E73|nr:uncharacterized protein LOC128997126 [Macrosteles quadrilineatus]
MAVQQWMCALIVLLMLDGAMSWYEDNYRWGHRGRSRRVFSYPRDWDIDWPASQRRAQVNWHGASEEVHGRHRHQDLEDQHYHYQNDQDSSGLHPRMVVLPRVKEETRGLWHSQQRGSALVAPGEEVRVTPARGSSSKFYRGTVTSKISDGLPAKKRNRGNNRHKNRGAARKELWQFSQDEPPRALTHGRSKVCARCPSDRAVLAKKGDTSVIMEVPPIIPCHPWSSIEKVKQEVLAGPEPGSEVSEGSHKVVIRLYRHKRTIVNCVTRYNVIVRKCPELEVGPAVRTDCPSGRTWGSVCNISCAAGYQLEGDVITECGDDLEWSGVTPQCLPTTSCPVPVSPDHGHLSCRTPQHHPVPARAKGVLPDGSVCHFRCDPGYAVPPSQQGLTKVRCIGGSWDNHQDPVCVETNELKEEETSPEISPDEALRFDGKGCPKDLCKNKGKCIVILGEPMCSCMTGYSGPTCEDQEEDLDEDPSQFNTIT